MAHSCATALKSDFADEFATAISMLEKCSQRDGRNCHNDMKIGMAVVTQQLINRFEVSQRCNPELPWIET
jgi:hypothetical protein